jgi:hypothetical protein
VIGPDFVDLAIVASLIVVSALITHLSSRRTLKRASEDARQQLELRLEGFTGAIAELETRVAELTSMTAALSAAEAINSIATSMETSNAAHTNGTASQSMAHTKEEIPTEILIVISAAVTSFLGKRVRIRSAKMLQSPYEIVNPWAQQGRATMQASHSLRSWSR